MKIAILSRNKRLYSTRRLVEAAEERGHEVQVIDALRCYMNIAVNNPTIHLGGNMHVYIKVAYSQQKNQPPEGG